jgi:hypothetical protein
LTDDLTLVYFGLRKGELFDKFIYAAKSHEKYLYYHMPSNCAVLYGAENETSLMVFRPFDESPIEYLGDI